MCKNKILILVSGLTWETEQEQMEGLSHDCIYKNIIVPLKLVRRLWFKFNIPYKEIWYGNWKKNMNQYETIILYDSVLGLDILDYIKKKHSNGRLIFWYYNIVNSVTNPNKIDRTKWELWSFDRGDCEIYNLQFNHQYFYDIQARYDNEYDLIFIGREKGRKELVQKIVSCFEKNNLTTYIKLFDDEKKVTNYFTKKTQYYSYDKVLSLTLKAKAILDIVQEGQCGLTRRVLESIFLEKKLITNNMSIKKEPFYNENNIFIINNNSQDLIEFMNKKFQPINEILKKEYTYKNWLGKFFEDKV